MESWNPIDRGSRFTADLPGPKIGTWGTGTRPLFSSTSIAFNVTLG